MASHAAGARARRDRSRGDPRRGGAWDGRRRLRHARPSRDTVPDRVDLEVVRRDRRDAGGGGGAARSARLRERAPAVARAPRAVRSDHDASPAHAHRRPPRPARRTRHGFAGALHLLRSIPGDVAAGGAVRYSNDGYKIVGAVLEGVTGTPIHELLARARCSGRSACALGGRDHRRRSGRPRDRLRADVHRPAGPAPPSARAGHADRVATPPTARSSRTWSTWRVRAAAPRARRRPDARGGGSCPRTGFARLMAGAVDDDDARPVRLRPVDRGRRRADLVGHSGGMVGYTALLVALPEEGLGCVVLQNGGGDRRGRGAPRSRAVRAALAGDDAARAWSPPRADRRSRTRTASRARTTGDDGRDVRASRPRDDGLSSATRAGHGAASSATRSIRAGRRRSWCAHRRSSGSRSSSRRDDDGRVVEAFHGRHVVPGGALPARSAEPRPRSGAGYPGLYRSDDPWAPALRVVAAQGRGSRSVAERRRDDEEDGELVPARRRLVRGRASRDPRRVRFDGDGRGRHGGDRRLQRGSVVSARSSREAGELRRRARNATQAFCPPNPNEFDSASVTSSSRASFGTYVEVAVRVGRRVVDRRRDRRRVGSRARTPRPRPRRRRRACGRSSTSSTRSRPGARPRRRAPP